MTYVLDIIAAFIGVASAGLIAAYGYPFCRPQVKERSGEVARLSFGVGVISCAMRFSSVLPSAELRQRAIVSGVVLLVLTSGALIKVLYVMRENQPSIVWVLMSNLLLAGGVTASWLLSKDADILTWPWLLVKVVGLLFFLYGWYDMRRDDRHQSYLDNCDH